MRFITALYIALQFFTVGCSTVSRQVPDTHLVAPENVTQSQATMDQYACSRYSYWEHGKILDQTYYDACMNTKGYKEVTTTRTVTERKFLGIIDSNW